MPDKTLMRDMVIILPGITGSVLQQHGKDLWATSGGVFWRTLKHLGGNFDALRLDGDDPDLDTLDDGIRATGLIPDMHIVPGLVKVDGYSKVANLVRDNFEIIEGRIDDPAPANFYEFPYDWRRDNRAAARRLKTLIDRQLPIWREHSFDDNAQVILIAHSMGGLVAHYYLEALEGDNWRHCKALFTFGTPFRGSLQSLAYLANGYKKMFIDLTDVMRSFTSTYQLLPIYEALRVDGRYQRVAETVDVPGIDPQRARDGLAFHREIEAAVTRHSQEADYRAHGYALIPFVGTRQPTPQSAQLEDGRLTASSTPPDVVPASLGDGDGTVPRVSAIPQQLSTEYRETYSPEQHAALQTNRNLLYDLRDRLRRMQAPDLSAVRGPAPVTPGGAIGLSLDDAYRVGEPVELRAQLLDGADAGAALAARLQAIADTAPVPDAPEQHLFAGTGAERSLTLQGLTPGVYRIEVRSAATGPAAPPPVHGLFAVVDE